MEIWIPLLYPIIIGALAMYFFKHKVIWWEALIPIGVAILFIIVFRFFVIKSITTDTEYWGGTVQKVEYYEDWNEYIHKTCYHHYKCGKSTCSRPYDCSYVQYHPASWQITDNNGIVQSISESEYNRLMRQFKQKPTFVELARNSYTNDGDKYVFYWQGEKETFEPMYTEHTYENRVQASHSVYNYPDVSEEEAKHHGLHKYANIYDGRYQHSILGANKELHKDAEREFTWLNSKLGKAKGLRVWVLLYGSHTPSTGQMQERYWKGGNDNEFVICIGTDSSYSAINWCHVFSWSEVQEPKINVRDFVMRQSKLDLLALAGFVETELSEKFIRKDFKEFSYLTVDPPGWAITWCHIVTLVVTIGITIWSIFNPIEE